MINLRFIINANIGLIKIPYVIWICRLKYLTVQVDRVLRPLCWKNVNHIIVFFSESGFLFKITKNLKYICKQIKEELIILQFFSCQWTSQVWKMYPRGLCKNTSGKFQLANLKSQLYYYDVHYLKAYCKIEVFIVQKYKPQR